MKLNRKPSLREICSMQSLYDEQQRLFVWSLLSLTAE